MNATIVIRIEKNNIFTNNWWGLAADIRRRLETVAGVTGVRVSRREGQPEERWILERERIAQLGLTVREVGRTLLASVAGIEAGRFREGGDDAMELAGTHTGVNPSVVLLTLALVGLAGAFFGGYLLRPFSVAWAERRSLCVRAMALGAGAGLVLAVALPSSFDREAGRYSGLWNAIGKLPTLADRSPVMLALAPLGGAVLAALWLTLTRRSGWMLVASVAGFAIAQSANHQAWQRYVEPMALIVLTLGVALALAPQRDEASARPPRWAHAGPLALAALLALVTIPRIGG